MLTDSNIRTTIGSQGEYYVSTWLQQEHFTILERNYRKKYGEIDLIAIRSNVLIFVEVKTRTANYFNLSTVVTLSKQKKIILTAKQYIAHHHYDTMVYRFDLALLEGSPGNYNLTYIPNAFVPASEE